MRRRRSRGPRRREKDTRGVLMSDRTKKNNRTRRETNYRTTTASIYTICIRYIYIITYMTDRDGPMRDETMISERFNTLVVGTRNVLFTVCPAQTFFCLFSTPPRDETVFTGKSLCRERRTRGRFFCLYGFYNIRVYMYTPRRRRRRRCVVHTVTRRARTHSYNARRTRIPILYTRVCVCIIHNIPTCIIIIIIICVPRLRHDVWFSHTLFSKFG